MTRNKLTYSEVTLNGQVHSVGTIWASILFEVYWNLIDKLGFTENIKDAVESGKGNAVFLKMFIGGMKLQPCRPTFIQARDAIIESDRLKNNGSNKCEILKGFAKRGMGFNNAKPVVSRPTVNDFTLPADC